MSRPANRWAYEGADLISTAAAYAFGIARSHPFVDGNKRMAFITLATFLDINGVDLRAEQADVVATILALTAGELSEAELAAVIRKRWT